MNRAVTYVHQAIMASLGLIFATLLFGGPFGFTPAWASLICEIREGRGGYPGLFKRILRGTKQRWLSCSIGGLVLVLAFVPTILTRQLPFQPIHSINVTIAVWGILFSMHTAFLSSLGLAKFSVKLKGGLLFIFGAWVYLVVFLLWFALLASLFTSFFPLVFVFGPWLIAMLHCYLDKGLAIAVRGVLSQEFDKAEASRENLPDV